MKTYKRIIGVALFLTIILIAIFIYRSFIPIDSSALDKFLLEFEKKGFTVDLLDVDKDILAGERKFLTINQNEHIQVYMYRDNKEMEADASRISADGFKYTNNNLISNISWIAPPHFYKSLNIIVLYCGENTDIINSLSEILGEQFAGSRGE